MGRQFVAGNEPNSLVVVEVVVLARGVGRRFHFGKEIPRAGVDGQGTSS